MNIVSYNITEYITELDFNIYCRYLIVRYSIEYFELFNHSCFGAKTTSSIQNTFYIQIKLFMCKIVYIKVNKRKNSI